MEAKKSKSKTKGDLIKLENILDAKIGFIGAGKITESIINGLLNYGKISTKNIFIAAPSDRNVSKFKELGCTYTKRNIDIFARYNCDIIFLCVHGSVIHQCYKNGGLRPQALTVNYIPNMKHMIYILSLISGYDLNQIKAVLLNPEHPKKYHIEMHRIMINSACAYGLGICAIDCEPDSNKLSPILRTMLSFISRLEYVPENQIDAACAICGSGLAFAYYFISAMADGAFKVGLNRQMALKFAAKTIQCAGQSLLETGKHPGELRDAVCSPKGAAIYGIHVLDQADVSSGISAAIEAAHKRAQDLCKS